MSFIKTLWSDLIYKYLYEDQDLQKMFNRDLETLIRQGGNKITIPTVASGASVVRTDALTVGSGLPLTPKDIEKDSMDLVIYEYSTEPLVIRNIDVIQSNQNLLQAQTAEIAQMFKEHMIQSILTHIISNVHADHKLDWTGGTSGSKFSLADMGAMEVAFDDAKILTNDRFAAWPSAQALNVMTESGMQAWIAQQQQNLLNGQFPQLMGFNLTKSALIPKTTAAGAIDATPANNTKNNVVGWRKQHMHLVVQTEIEIVGSEDAKYLGGVYAFTTRYGVKLDRSKAGVISTQQS